MSQLNILLIDTATAACSVALAQQVDPQAYIQQIATRSDCKITEKWQLAPRQHAEIILPMLDALLQAASMRLQDIDLIAFTSGSGSFIGVRTAAAVVQGIAFAHQIPVVSVPTLQVLAQASAQQHQLQHVLALWDARMGEVYYGLYHMDQHAVMQSQIAEQLIAPGKLLPALYATDVTLQDVVGVGNGWQAYASELVDFPVTRVIADSYPHAAAMLPYVITEYMAGRKHAVHENAYPHYLRKNVAHKPKQKT